MGILKFQYSQEDSFMKGWLLKAAHEPLELVERPDPVPGPGQIAIDIKAAGLCHSDVGLMEGITISQLAYYPIIIGHEFAGTVYAVGEGVTDFKIGDRVACRAGYGAPGVSMEGAYADKTVAPAMYCTIVPDDVPWAQAAAATDAGLTAYHAVAKTAGIKAGDRVGIVGIGGLGTNAVQVALALGAEVYGSTRKAAVREEVERMGVKATVATADELQQFKLDTIIDFAGFENTILGSINALNYGGTLVLIGLGSPTVTLNVTQFVGFEHTLKSSIGGTVEDLKEVLKLIQEGKLSIPTSPITFDEIPEGLERLKQGKVIGRLVAMMD